MVHEYVNDNELEAEDEASIEHQEVQVTESADDVETTRSGRQIKGTNKSDYDYATLGNNENQAYVDEIL